MKTLKTALMLPLVVLIPSRPASHDGGAPATPPHCQVPCGIYADQMRIDMLMEDAATIEKAMTEVRKMESADRPDYNQIVRWITTKDDHAQHVQDMAGDYWLTQRVKIPASDAQDAARAKYASQLEHMHGILVAAMKCKQTTEVAHVRTLRQQALAFGESYFSEDDMKHIKEHHQGHK